MIPGRIRLYRESFGLSQAAFARRLGVPPETYRTWDSGRGAVPAAVLSRAHELAGCPDDQELLLLETLARLVGVHVRTLRNAARDGRLCVTYDTRTTFRRLRPRATLASGLVFRTEHYRRRVRLGDRRAPLTWISVPTDFDVRILEVQRRLTMSQAQFAVAVSAAGKAVAYQWEARKRCPSPVFWERIEHIERSVLNRNS